MRQLEEQYAAELVVIGVHSGKYTAERDTANVRDAVLRLGIRHPVVNDRQFRIWKGYAVNAWPTVVLVDPRGYYIGSHAGEITAADFGPVIAEAVATFDRLGTLDRRLVPFHPAHWDEPARPLRYPGKVLAVAGSGGAPDRLFIADSDHHRVIGARPAADGRSADVAWIAGSGAAGSADGPFAAAQFQRPQGMALAGDTLYVADSENHTIRSLELIAGQVATVAGTGEIGAYQRTGGPARRTALNSPWDLAWVGNRLYIAMAGYHQLWVYDPPADTALPYAGTGREALGDGKLWTAKLNAARTMEDLRGYASLAQPTGLTSDGSRLFVACSEAQAIRTVGLDTGEVHTLVGTGLFDFADKDGVGDAVRLQHPFGVAYHAASGRLLVADTYNSKIKWLDPATCTVTTWLGGNPRALTDGPAATARFNEPEGVSVAGERLYIADTNNHAIRVVDLRDPTGTVTTLELRGLV